MALVGRPEDVVAGSRHKDSPGNIQGVLQEERGVRLLVLHTLGGWNLT